MDHGSHLALRQLRTKKTVLSRSSPCPYRSGKKYKECHLAPAA